jgi:hypothetical protein
VLTLNKPFQFTLKISKLIELTGILSKTLDTLGDEAFPSTKSKKVETPITL